MSDRPALPAALEQIAAGASAAAGSAEGSALPLATIRAAARRRRVRWQAGVTVAAAAVVGVLVLGAAAAGGLLDRDPVPPVQNPDSWDVDYSFCGQRSPNWGGAVAMPITLFPSGEVLVDSQALLTLETLTGGTEAFPEVTVQKVGTRHDIVAFDGAGTVVGVLGEPGDGATDELVPYTLETASLTTTAPLLSCAAHDGVTRLEPGSYGLTVSRRVEVLADGVAEEERVAYSPVLTVPEPLADGDPSALQATSLDGAAPRCGATFDALPAGDAAISIRLDDAARFDAGIVSSMWGASLNLTNNMPGASTIQVAEGGVQLLITADGVVVGHGRAGVTDAPFPFEPGTTRAPLFNALAFYDCSGRGDVDLPAGEYEIWAFVPVAGEEPTSLVAGPWPLTALGVDLDPANGAAADPAESGLPPLADVTLLPPMLRFDNPLSTEQGPESLIRWDDHACSGTDDPGRWVASYPDGTGFDGDPTAPFSVNVVDRRVTRFEAHTPGPWAPGGIQVGWTLDELLGVYYQAQPIRSAADTGEPIDAWAYVDPALGTWVFEVSTNAGIADYWTPDELEHIVAMVALDPDSTYDYPAWGSDFCG